MRYVIPSALAIMTEVDFFSVRSFSKVINRKQIGHIALHGLYHTRVYHIICKIPGTYVRYLVPGMQQYCTRYHGMTYDVHIIYTNRNKPNTRSTGEDPKVQILKIVLYLSIILLF